MDQTNPTGPTTPPSLWPPSFAGAIFDFDGTIAETHDIWHEVDRIFLGMRGHEVPEDYARILSTLGFAGGAQYTIETFHLNETVEEVCDEWNRMGQALYETRVTLRPGAETYIQALRSRGIRCALATVNDPEVLEACNNIDVKALFDARVYGVDVTRPKDFPDIYLEAASRLGVSPENCIVFEDLAPGLRSSRQAGFATCAVLNEDPMQKAREVVAEADMALADWTEIPLDA